MLTHDSHYKQVDGLAMGSPPAPHLANGWLSQFDDVIRKDAKLFSRYMDDIVREMNTAQINNKFVEVNKLDENLKFTMEREEDHSLVHLDMRIIHDKESGKLSSTWYNNPTDTDLIRNYHELAPKRYKRSVVSGFVHRIHRACSTTIQYQSFSTPTKSKSNPKIISQQNTNPSISTPKPKNTSSQPNPPHTPIKNIQTQK